MQYFQHDFERAEDYLHHRPPYLLVDEIQHIAERSILTKSTVPSDSGYIRGHFPGAPILPGAMMQEMTTQTAGILIAARFNPMREYNTHDPFFNEQALGVLVRIKEARYLSFARPGDVLEINATLENHLDSVFEFSAAIACCGTKIMSNKFQLANIPSQKLQGVT